MKIQLDIPSEVNRRLKIFRPIKGTRGFYRAAMRHGVSEVHTGRRHTLGIIFHDALS